MSQEMELPPIHYATYIAVPPERVYETLTTAAGWDAWFTQGTEIDPRPGGTLRLRWVDFGADRITDQCVSPILEAAPPRRFVFRWTPGDSTTTVAFDLSSQGSGTRVEVTESGHTASPRDLFALVDCAGGWGEALTLLKFYLEHGVTYGPVPAI